MEIITHTVYKCEVCGNCYDTEKAARLCELVPVTQDKGARVGDTVVITHGDGEGKSATVESVRVIAPNDFPHRYWHTVALVVSINDEPGGQRLLTFDSYVV